MLIKVVLRSNIKLGVFFAFFCAYFSRQQVRLCLFLSIENLRRCVLKLPPSQYKAVNSPGSLKVGSALHLSTLFGGINGAQKSVIF